MVAETSQPSQTDLSRLYFSRVVGKPIVDANGERVAKVKDLVVRFGSARHPPVSGLVARQGRREFYLDWSQVAGVSEQGARLATFTVDLRPFARRDGEVLLRHDVLDKQLIDVDGRRVVRANDLLLARVDGEYRLVGVDVGAQALWRRLGPAALTAHAGKTRLIDWEDVESFATDVPMVRLRVAHEGVSKLHPVEIAQIVEGLSPRQGQEIIEALDDETAADTVQELDPDDAADLLERLDPERAADILEEMEPDDAADVLAEMESADSDELLDLMEPEESDDVRELMDYAKRYHDDTAAGLMTTEFIAVAPDLTARQALDGLRAVPEVPDPLYHLYLATEESEPGHQRLVGVVTLRDLALADPATPLTALAEEHVRTVHPDEPAREVARTMAEYNLATLPVVDEHGCILGVVHVDDAMDVLLPELWSRRLADRLFQ
jgi:magnesium transporter